MITLYDCVTAPSPRRARILLAEKGLRYETVNIDLRGGEQFGERYRRINPLRTEEGVVLTDNAAITAYVEALRALGSAVIVPRVRLHGSATACASVNSRSAQSR